MADTPSAEDHFRFTQIANVWCMRPKDFAAAYGVTVQTLANWRVNRSDGPIWIKEEGVILYPVEDNIQRLRSIPRRKSTSDDGNSGSDILHPLVTDFPRTGTD